MFKVLLLVPVFVVSIFRGLHLSQPLLAGESHEQPYDIYLSLLTVFLFFCHLT